MATRKELTVVLSPTVVDDLHGIWQWNAGHHSPAHADAYIAFLKARIYGLRRYFRQGRIVSARPDLRYFLIRRKSRGQGHVAVYRFDDKSIVILHVFHTAQDWQSKLAEE
jgi:plasmid stabilization system protein ParE